MTVPNGFRPVGIPPGGELLVEREKTHGNFADPARVSQALKSLLRAAPNWSRLTDVQREALDMTATKLSRILCGNPDFDDHWRDLSGYAQLVVRDLESRVSRSAKYFGNP